MKLYTSLFCKQYHRHLSHESASHKYQQTLADGLKLVESQIGKGGNFIQADKDKNSSIFKKLLLHFKSSPLK